MTAYDELVAEIAAASAALLPVPATAQEIADLVNVPTAAEVAALVPTVPGPPGASPFALLRDFDDAFSRWSKDDDKVRALNDAHMAASGLSPAYVVNRRIPHTVPLLIVSGMVLHGGRFAPAREYGRGPGFVWGGPDGSAQLTFPADQVGKPAQPGGQKYPNAFDPRDVSIRFLEFVQTPTTDCIDDYPGYVAGAGHVPWYTEFHGCGFRNGRSLFAGNATGISLTGPTHVQGYSATAINSGGSECALFDTADSFMDSNAPGWATAGLPLLESRLEKSVGLGEGALLTARQNSYGLKVSGGNGSRFFGRLDAQDGDPMWGAAVIQTGGTGHRYAVGIKGAMARPADATGAGMKGHRAELMILGGTAVIDGASFSRKASTVPSSTPVVWVGPNVPAGGVTIGANAYDSGAPKLVHQSKAGQVICLDPSVSVVVAP